MQCAQKQSALTVGLELGDRVVGGRDLGWQRREEVVRPIGRDERSICVISVVA